MRAKIAPLHPLPADYLRILSDICDQARSKNLMYTSDVEAVALPILAENDPAVDLFLGWNDGNSPSYDIKDTIKKVQEHPRGSWALVARSASDYTAIMSTGESGCYMFDREFNRPPRYDVLLKELQVYEVRRVFFGDRY